MLKDKLKQGKTVLGTWCDIPSVTTINIMAEAGFDFVIIDMEHGPMDFTLAQNMIMAAECVGSEALVRVPCLDEASILRALDIGASGVVIPQIETIEDRKQAVQYAKFAPKGTRGFNPYVRSGHYHNYSGYFQEKNDNTLVGLLLEGPEALQQMDAIIDDPAIDLIYIGTYDLSAALGIPGEVNSPTVLRALEQSVQKILAKGKAAGCMIHNEEEIQLFQKLGIQFITYKVDTAILYDECRKIKQTLCEMSPDSGCI